MIIRQRRIRNLDRYLGYLDKETSVVVGISNISDFRDKLREVGFSDNLETGESVLPSPTFGLISQYNAEGKIIVHRDQTKETAYRQVEWNWVEWHGPYRVDQSKIVDVPYERYPRSFIPPPSIELNIAATTDGEPIVVGPVITYAEENEPLLLHVINLFLEIFGECSLFTENLEKIIRQPVRRLNWRVLPPGRWPWERLRTEIEPIISEAPRGNQPVIQHRLETINSYGPNFTAVGQAGFRGYLIFGFEVKNLYVLESAFFGNATYVFGEDWERLSRMTKAEILDRNLQTDRIIHREGWENRIHDLLGDNLFEN